MGTIDDSASAKQVVFDPYRFTRADLRAAGDAIVAGIGVLGPLSDQTALEIIATPHTPQTQLVSTLVRGWSVDAYHVRETAGLYIGATVASIIDEARHASAEGVAEPAAIDLALTLGVRYPYGPFAWLDRIGAARIAAVLNTLGAGDFARSAHTPT